MTTKTSLLNVRERAELVGTFRSKARSYEQKSVPLNGLDEVLAAGWALRAKRKKSATVRRPKRHDVDLEDRVWSLLWRVGFKSLSMAGGALLQSDTPGATTITNQLDVVAIDDEVCVAVECKSSAARARRPSLQEELSKLAAARGRIAAAINPSKSSSKRTVILVFWTRNAIVSAQDRERARQSNIVLLDDDDLSYHEALVGHLGEAARYQFLADLTPGRAIPGLAITVPALQSKMGGFTAYTFAVQPEFLLKVAYVSHRARGRASDIPTYQRMVQRAG